MPPVVPGSVGPRSSPEAQAAISTVDKQKASRTAEESTPRIREGPRAVPGPRPPATHDRRGPVLKVARAGPLWVNCFCGMPKPPKPPPRPVRPPQPVPRPAPGGPAPPAPSGPTRPDALDVVVVDDDARYRELAAEPFRSRGDVVRTYADGLEALSQCLQQPPDVILSDVTMPRMDGWQLLRLVRAREQTASIPVVFLTTLGGESERLLGYQLGVDAYIPKPYNPQEMLVRVHRIVQRSKTAPTAASMGKLVRGELEHVALSSLLSFFDVEKKSGVLLVIGENVGRILVAEGRVMQAEIEGSTIRNSKFALKSMLDWTSGQFEFTPQEVDVEDQLRTSVTAILLEHARQADEKGPR